MVSYPVDSLSSAAPLLLERTPDHPAHVLVVDDQHSIRSLLHDVLSTNHYQVSLAQNMSEADVLLRQERFDAVIVDIYLGEHEDGLDLLPSIRELQPNTPAIVISGMANMNHVMVALKAGAYDMLCKPFNILDVLHVIARAVEKKRMADENERLVAALRRERDLLEERVQGATRDLQEKVETLRLLNEQIATMFEMSQMPSGDGTSAGMVRNVFGLLHRMINYEGAFCIVYDLKARDISLTYCEDDALKEFCGNMAALFRAHGATLAELAEANEYMPLADLQGAVRGLYPHEWPSIDLLLMPLHVHQTLMGMVGLVRKQPSTHLSQVEERILAIAISHFLAALEQRSFIARTGQLTGLGELISEIAHDLRHPMTALRGASRLLLDGWQEERRRNRCIEEIHTNLSRMESLVSELVNFYNPKEMNMIPVDVNALLEKALGAGRGLLEQKGITAECHFEPGPLMILGLSRNLMEAFINLIANACQAMEAGGRLTLSTSTRMSPEQAERLRQAGRQPAQYVLIQVADTGCGIPEENRERVFLRFFTTRREGHGLGLSAVQRIVKKNLGHIYFDTQVGQGTVFHLFLPKA